MLHCKVGVLYRPCLFHVSFLHHKLAEKKVIKSIKIDNNISSSELFAVHVSEMLCFVFLGRKLLGRNSLGA